MNLEFNQIRSNDLQINVQILQEGVLNGGESHVTLVDLVPNLHHFLTLPKVPNKSYHRVSNEEPLIDYNKNIMMTSEHYLAILEQKLVRKEATIKNKMFEKNNYWHPSV
jgi:hypothetical protein